MLQRYFLRLAGCEDGLNSICVQPTSPRDAMSTKLTDAEIAANVARLSKETIREWTIRFYKERGLPIPDEKELEKIIALGEDDERTAHQ